MVFEWAVNTFKLDQAKRWSAEQAKLGKGKGTEATVKERYIALGGLVRDPVKKEEAPKEEKKAPKKDKDEDADAE